MTTCSSIGGADSGYNNCIRHRMKPTVHMEQSIVEKTKKRSCTTSMSNGEQNLGKSQDNLGETCCHLLNSSCCPIHMAIAGAPACKSIADRDIMLGEGKRDPDVCSSLSVTVE